MYQIITLVIIYGTRFPFESILVTVFPTWKVGTIDREGGLSCFSVLVGKKTIVGGKSLGAGSSCM